MKKTPLLIFAIAAILIGGILIAYLRSSQSIDKNITKNNNLGSGSTKKTVTGLQGKILAGKNSPYLEYNQSDYDQALKSGKIIFLDFYANWCPVCRGEAPEIESGFDSLEEDNVVGFRVNYNDSETDADEKKLAQEFGITYQHTKVIIKDGEEVLKNGEVWDTERFLAEITKYTNLKF